MQSLKVPCIEATKCTHYPSDVFDKVVKMIALFHPVIVILLCAISLVVSYSRSSTLLHWISFVCQMNGTIFDASLQ